MCSTGYTPASQQDSINCTSEKYFFQESFAAPNHTKFSCKFTADMLQNCSGLVDPSFGFEEGKPCFIIKMNRVSYKGPALEMVSPHTRPRGLGPSPTHPDSTYIYHVPLLNTNLEFST